MEHTTFRERLCHLRDLSGLRQAEISALCNLSDSAAGHLFTGRNDFPSAETALELARVFGVTTDYLLRGIGSPDPSEVSAAVSSAVAQRPEIKARVEKRTARGCDPNDIADAARAAEVSP